MLLSAREIPFAQAEDPSYLTSCSLDFFTASAMLDPLLNLYFWSKRHFSSADKNKNTLFLVEAAPISPIRQTLPLKAPKPPPISIPNSLRSCFRTVLSSTPAG